jgi:cation diffusion facilitator CzcD-associated flavoprotein CzcO
MASHVETIHDDVAVVGAGFAGMHNLYNLRKFGYNVHLFEGIWYWNCYPSARVDTEVPIYQYSAEETWDQWEWSELYPTQSEVQRYLAHVERVWNLGPDINYWSRVTSARWCTIRNLWTLTIQDERNRMTSIITANFVIFCTGLAASPYEPPYKGSKNFKGLNCHAGPWPQGGMDLKNRRVGVIGTGATGVQVIQECGPVVSHLTVFQRTPNIALPMKQGQLDHEKSTAIKRGLTDIFKETKRTWAGFLYTWHDQEEIKDSEETRHTFFEQKWSKGGFYFWIGSYKDIAMNQDANRAAYDFWRAKVIKRIRDPVLQEHLAPTEPIHPIWN